ncbi:MAG: glutamine--tRNA ligase/YqeY domain fusion protein [Myxococcota bacterium]
MEEEGSNFIRTIVEQHLEEGRYDTIITRFPPEPNGYLHVGHAKAICVDFGTAAQYGGRCHLRFDDTNPVAEDPEFAEGIMEDIRWLGFDWGEHLYYASDYFPQLYEWAVRLVKEGKAYVDSLSEEQIREYRGTVTEAGRPSPYRERPVDESLELLDGMRTGKFPEGAHVLRAKGDMAHPNMKMRDPLMYRILHRHHDRTGDAWHIYPMYDYAHGLSDAIENISHSICTLEFDNNRALYDLFLDLVGFTEPRPHQYEMARLNLPYTMMSKRKLRKCVEDGLVEGWDDPRMPTLRGMRNKGIPPEAIRSFVERVGVAKTNSVVDTVLLDNAIRDFLNPRVPRLMAVLDPLEVVITNWPEGQVDWLDASLYPHDVPLEGTRRVPFTGQLVIERDDFMEAPVKGFRRLAPGREVRLRYGYLVTCTNVVKDASGAVIRLECTYDPASRGGVSPDGRKVPGTIHWVSATEGKPVDMKLYERLFDAEFPDQVEDWRAALNPNSLRVVRAIVEPALLETAPGDRVQLERTGYFYADPHASTPGAPAFKRIVELKDSWQKVVAASEPAEPASVPSPRASEPAVTERVRTDAELAAIAALVARGVGEEEASVLADDARLAGLFEKAAAGHAHPGGVARWVVHGIGQSDTGALTIAALGRLVTLAEDGTITNRIARDVLAVLMEEGGDPDAIVDSRGWRPIDDDRALVGIVDAVIAENPTEAEAWRGGKDRLAGFFVGQVMKRTQGRADARRVNELLAERRGG